MLNATWLFLFDEKPPPDAPFEEDFEFWKLEKDQADSDCARPNARPSTLGHATARMF